MNEMMILQGEVAALTAERDELLVVKESLTTENTTLTARVEALYRTGDALLEALRQADGPIFYTDEGRDKFGNFAAAVYSTPALDLAKHDEAVKREVVDRIINHVRHVYGVVRGEGVCKSIYHAAGIEP